MDFLNEDELIKLLDILRSKNISADTIKNLCNVTRLSNLNKRQYNILLYLLLTKGVI